MDGTIQTKRFVVDRSAYLEAMWTRGLPRRMLLVAPLCVTIGVLVASILGASALLWLVPVLLLTLALSLALRYFLFRRRIYDPLSRSIYQDPRTITFSVDGVRVWTEGGVESTLPWSRVVRAEVRGGFVLLFMNRLQHFIVPLNEFASPGERDAFWLLVRARGLVKAEPPTLP